MDDIVNDQNAARPIVAGGTGAPSASGARTNLAVPGLADTSTVTGAWTVSGTWTVSGAWTITGNMTFNDSVKAIFGTGSDLQIYHNGSNSFIEDAGTGALSIKGSLVQVIGTSDEVLIRATAGGASELRHNGATKLTTTTTGVTVTGLVSGDTIGGAMVSTSVSSDTGSTTKVPHVSAVEAAIAAAGVGGVGQTWQDVSGSRVAGTSYQNTTGKPIMAAMYLTAGSIKYAQVSSDNSTWIKVGNSQADNSPVSFIVPDDWYYRVETGTTIGFWSELR